MTRVEIQFEGPVMDNLCRVTVWDTADENEFHLDQADVEAARGQGPAANGELLALVLDNCNPTTGDMLRAALMNDSPVSLDGADLPHEELRAALAPAGHAPGA